MRRGRCSFILTTAVLGIFAMVLMGCEGSSDNNNLEDKYFWKSMGSPGVGRGTRFAIAIDPSDNKPIVVFIDYMADEIRPHVAKWRDSNNWIDLGFPTTRVAEQPSLTIDPSDNKPIVAFNDNSNGGKAHVKKWSSGTTWTDLGFPSTGSCFRPAITIDPLDNKPVVVFVDSHNNYRPQVKKWSAGTTWTDLGFPGTGVGRDPSITIDPSDNKPVVAFRDNDNGSKAHVMKWSTGTTWTDLGFPSAGEASYTSIVIDPSDNKPIVVFVNDPIEKAQVEKAQVMKWSSGTTWTDLGFLSNKRSDTPAITIDPLDNKPVVAFRDWANYDFPANFHVKKWSSGTTWIGLGWLGLGTSESTSIVIDPSDNKPIAMYSRIEDNDAVVYVMKHP